jgi:hypothetical protein
VAYLQSFLGVQSDVGLLAPSGYQSLFGNRYPYRSALSFEVRGKLFELNKQSLSLYARYLHDFSVQGHWVLGELEYRPWKHMGLMVGVDLLAATRASAINGGAGYLGAMASFDRARFGVRIDL